MDPERPIEKLLREFARKRGEEFGAPPKMHPTARRALREAIAQQFRKPSGAHSTWVGLFTGFWPRLAWSLGACAVVALAVLIVLPGIRPQTSKQEMAVMREALPAAQVTKREQLPPIARPEQLTLADARQSDSSLPVSGTAPLPPALDNEKLRSEVVLQQTALAPEPIVAQGPPPAGAPLAATVVSQNESLVAKGESKVASLGNAATTPPPAEGEVLLRRYGLARNQATHPVTAVTSAPASPGLVAPTAAQPLANQIGNNVVLQNEDRLAFRDSGLAAGGANTDVNRSFAAYYARPTTASPAQRFMQVSTPSDLGTTVKRSRAQKQVLNSFQLVQNGPELQIVDGDNSVYSGTIQPPGLSAASESRFDEKTSAGNRLWAVQSRQNQRSPALSEVQQQVVQNYFFNVVGTNRTLNQRVVFMGTIQGMTNVNFAVQNSNALGEPGGLGGTGQVQNAPTLLNFIPVANSRISGKLKVGNAKEVEINAIPAKP